MTFNDKTLLITGASSGIGRTTAIEAAKKGAKIIAVARDEDRLKSLLDELNTISTLNHTYLVCDLSQETSISELAAQIAPCDGVVHSAGIVSPLPVKFIKEKHLSTIWSINTHAPILLTGALLRNNKINNHASIVFISSISTDHPYFGGAMYVSSKAAIEAYSRSLALELCTKKIRSNVVAPALVKTAIFNQTIDHSDKETLKKYEDQYPFGFGEPEDVAESILFFLSSASKWITGQKLILDGGLTLNTSQLK